MAHWPAVHQEYQSIGIFNELVSRVLNSKDIDFIYIFFLLKILARSKKHWT